MRLVCYGNDKPCKLAAEGDFSYTLAYIQKYPCPAGRLRGHVCAASAFIAQRRAVLFCGRLTGWADAENSYLGRVGGRWLAIATFNDETNIGQL